MLILRYGCDRCIARTGEFAPDQEPAFRENLKANGWAFFSNETICTTCVEKMKEASRELIRRATLPGRGTI